MNELIIRQHCRFKLSCLFSIMFIIACFMSANKTIVQADETNTQVEKATYGVVIVVAGVKDLNNNQVYNATIAHGIIVGNDNLNFL